MTTSVDKATIGLWPAHRIPDKFAELPATIKKDPAVVKQAMKQCSAQFVDTLFEKLPEAFQNDPAVAKFAIKCGLSARVFKVLPASCKQDSDVVQTAIEECHSSYLPCLFKLLPEVYQKDSALALKCIEKCTVVDTDIALLVKFLEDVGHNKDPAVMMKAVEKATLQFDNYAGHVIPAKFAALPGSLRQNPAVCQAALYKAGGFHCKAMFAEMPDSVKDRQDIKDHFEVLKGRGKLKNKFSELFKRAGRLALASIACGGAFEGLFGLSASSMGKVVNSNWSRGPDNAWKFHPVAGCDLPPPQPLWFAALCDVLKILFFTVWFGYIKRDLVEKAPRPVSKCKRAAFVLAACSQLVLVPYLVAANILSFVTQVMPHMADFWSGYECFYLRWNSSFLDFSYALLLVRFLVAGKVLEFAGDRSGGFNVEIGRERPHHHLKVALLEGDHEGNFAVRKVSILMWACITTATLYIGIGIPFLITHKIPGVLIFSPVLLFVATLAAAVQYVTAPELGSALKARGRDELRWNHEFWDRAERTGCLMFLPTLFAMSVCNLILTFASVYFYDGLGWRASVTLVVAERHMDRYAECKILSKYWPMASLIGEVI